MKKLIYITLLLIPFIFNGQNKLITKSGSITFEASVPAFEEVKATNEAVTCVLNTSNGEIASLALMKGFRFKVALMEEHFNENYVESDKYPKATFRGKIEKFDVSKLSSNSKEFTINGKLEIHGKTKDISIIAKLKKTEKGIEIQSDFDVSTDDFNIDIPRVVSKKLTKKVAITFDFELK